MTVLTSTSVQVSTLMFILTSASTLVSMSMSALTSASALVSVLTSVSRKGSRQNQRGIEACRHGTVAIPDNNEGNASRAFCPPPPPPLFCHLAKLNPGSIVLLQHSLLLLLLPPFPPSAPPPSLRPPPPPNTSPAPLPPPLPFSFVSVVQGLPREWRKDPTGSHREDFTGGEVPLTRRTQQ